MQTVGTATDLGSELRNTLKLRLGYTSDWERLFDPGEQALYHLCCPGGVCLVAAYDRKSKDLECLIIMVYPEPHSDPGRVSAVLATAISIFSPELSHDETVKLIADLMAAADCDHSISDRAVGDVGYGLNIGPEVTSFRVYPIT